MNDDDTEAQAEPTDDEDTEGLVLLPNPEISRQLARAREEEIQRNLKRHETVVEARRARDNRSATAPS